MLTPRQEKIVEAIKAFGATQVWQWTDILAQGMQNYDDQLNLYRDYNQALTHIQGIDK